jgi:hypothetical protein
MTIDAIFIEASPADLAQLDAERHEHDRAIGRGYDYDGTAPSHAEFLKRERQRGQRADEGEGLEVAGDLFTADGVFNADAKAIRQ